MDERIEKLAKEIEEIVEAHNDCGHNVTDWFTCEAMAKHVLENYVSKADFEVLERKYKEVRSERDCLLARKERYINVST